MKSIPKNEIIYVQNKNNYIITRNKNTGIWIIYAVKHNEYTKLGTGNNPLKLEQKFFNI